MHCLRINKKINNKRIKKPMEINKTTSKTGTFISRRDFISRTVTGTAVVALVPVNTLFTENNQADNKALNQ